MVFWHQYNLKTEFGLYTSPARQRSCCQGTLELISITIRPTSAQYSSNNIKTRKHDRCVIKRLKGLLGWGSMLASTRGLNTF